MKKIISLIILACMMLTLAACGAPAAAPAPAPEAAPAEEAAPAPEAAPAEETAPAEEASYKLGLGVSLSTASSKENNAQVDATVAAVVLDGEGKIVSCRIDVAQNKMDITDGLVDTEKTFRTKMELGSEYNMKPASPIGAEWDEQAKAFEAYVVGMTGAEVAAMETTEHNGHQISVDEALLAGCTMDITAFMTAVEKACSDEWAVEFTAADGFTLGVAAISEAGESTAATAEEDGVVKMYSEFAAVVLDGEGKIIAALNDATQPKITIGTAGEIVEAAFSGTKRELGDDYNMVKFGAAIAEWDAQSDAFSKYVVGMTGAEVAAMETTEHNGHQVTVDETLFASCTMQITGMMAVVALAADYAR